MRENTEEDIINEMILIICEHPSIKKIGSLYNNFGINNIKYRILSLENTRLRSHIISLYKHALEIKSKRGIREKDWINVVISILYHDISIIFFKEIDSLSWQEKRILGDQAHHSLSAMRIFLSVDDYVLAHCVRHNSSDFIYDLARNNILIPQLVLNLVDKSDISGNRSSISDKYEHIKNKIGHKEEFDDDSEKIACFYLNKVLIENRNLYDYEFIRSVLPKKKIITFIQRFDGKYCSPIGEYEDTNSNVKIAKIISNWGFSTLIINEGEGFCKYDENTYLVGLSEDNSEKMIPMYCYDKEIIIIEGTTNRLVNLKKTFGGSKKIVLLLRTMASGSMEKYRLENMKEADEVWVMTEEMKNILKNRFEEEKINCPIIKVLQSGFNPSVYYPGLLPRIDGKIVYVGALTDIKGVDVLIESFKKIKKEFVHAELHLIGDEHIYGDINHFNKDLYKDIEGIIPHGILREFEVAEQLRTAHFSCLLTKIYETFGKAGMQARACGTRMIVSDKGALPFHVQDINEGIVLKEVNIDSVYNAMKEILSQKPTTFLPPEDRYNYWLHTALDFYSHSVLITRKIIFNK